ncbi:MAG: hypothetical protein HUJ31_09370, partial [Pseudomonadales bacterium]|nr:hypothetical protein [Pseudomonadales bacterium]
MSDSWQSRLPEAVRMRAESLGESGTAWMRSLDDRVEHLKSLWDIEPGEVRAGGSESLVVEVTRADGSPAMIKIGLPGPSDLTHEAYVLKLGAGHGYADLYGESADVNAILIERLGESLSRRVESVDMQIRLICRTLCQAWMPVGADDRLMTGARKAEWLATFIREKWEALNRPCEQSTVDRALQFADQRAAAYSPDNSVLVHGDAHADNTLIAVDADREEEIICKF